MKQTAGSIFLACVLSLTMGGTMSDSVVVVTKQDAGREVRLAVGQTLRVEVQDISTTGYQWHAAPVEGGVLKFEGDELEPYPGVGAGGLRRYTYSAASPGGATLTFNLQRSWEKKQLEHFSIRVTVQANP